MKELSTFCLVDNWHCRTEKCFSFSNFRLQICCTHLPKMLCLLYLLPLSCVCLRLCTCRRSLFDQNLALTLTWLWPRVLMLTGRVSWASDFDTDWPNPEPLAVTQSWDCVFGFQLIRTLTLTLPLMSRPSLDASGDHAEEGSASQSVQHHTVEVEGGRTVVREMIGDFSEHTHSSVTLAR